MNYRENGNILIVGVECKELSKVQHLLYCVYHKYSAGRCGAGRSYAVGGGGGKVAR